MRQFNHQIDEYYSIDSTPDLFLSESQVLYALKEIARYDEESEIAVRELIKDVESINRCEKKGSMTSEQSTTKIGGIFDKFRDQFGFWPHVTKTYKAFYDFFIKDKTML